jgi:hypothetical protein
MLFGTITACGLSATFTIGAYHGYGQHASQISGADEAILRKIAFAIIFLYIVTLGDGFCFFFYAWECYQ